LDKWEYKAINWTFGIDDTDGLQKLLNEFGEKGFELVNVIPHYSSSSTENVIDDIFLVHQTVIFKRKK
jgi:hypothetical protein